MSVMRLPHGYSLHLRRHKGLAGQHLIAILRPDGTPIRICDGPPPWASRDRVRASILAVVQVDLATIAEEEKSKDG